MQQLLTVLSSSDGIPLFLTTIKTIVAVLTEKTLTETENFNIQSGAQNVLFFMGLGTNTRNVAVKVSNGTSSNTIYSGNVQFDLNLTSYDSTNIYHSR